ncbi:unnamed protein product [Linum tenue]|uniref:Uncharacterized protein n=1 Tax=Linum tenue TaxID=586396 RepID=A0AAV0GZN3_9ROSI|nr:unnamed protein product [Linum tenue]
MDFLVYAHQRKRSRILACWCRKWHPVRSLNSREILTGC